VEPILISSAALCGISVTSAAKSNASVITAEEKSEVCAEKAERTTLN
jgi:hypothetical protein